MKISKSYTNQISQPHNEKTAAVLNKAQEAFDKDFDNNVQWLPLMIGIVVCGMFAHAIWTYISTSMAEKAEKIEMQIVASESDLSSALAQDSTGCLREVLRHKVIDLKLTISLNDINQLSKPEACNKEKRRLDQSDPLKNLEVQKKILLDFKQ